MFNKVVMIGNLTRDVELRYLPSGAALATIGLASNRRYKKQDGTQAEEPCFIDVKLFGRAAEIANQYLHKGSRVLIEGRLTYETWVDQNGIKKSRHTITAESMNMLDSRSSSDGMAQEYSGASKEPHYASMPNSTSNQSYATQNSYANNAPKENYMSSIPEIDIDDDNEVPF